MSQLKLIVSAGARDAVRWARQHLYALLILSPLVLGMTYLGVGRMAREHAELEPSPLACVVLAAGALTCLVALSMSRASDELYHPRGAESFFDTLPVKVDTHLLAALSQRLARTAAVALVALVARGTFGVQTSSVWLLWPSLVLFVVLTALCEMLSALAWIHWSHVRSRAQASLCVCLLAPCVAVCAWLMLIVVAPQKVASPRWHVPLLACGALMSATLLMFVVLLHRRWRASDIEYAKRLGMGGGRKLTGVGGRVSSSLSSRLFGKSPATAAQVARDLRLTRRGFSSAVYTCTGLAALLFILLLAALTTSWLPPDVARAGFEATWFVPIVAVKFAAALVVVTLAALMPVLVAHERPHLWLERATGAGGAELWRAKLWYARLVSLPAPLVAWAAAMLTGASPAFYELPLLGELLWLWWMVSTVMGALAFEAPDQPGLAIVLMSCAGAAAGFVVALFWPAGVVLYIFGLQQMSARGQHLAHLHLMRETD